MDAVQKSHPSAGNQLLDREQDALARWAAAHSDETRWPLLSSTELKRLRFLAWRRATGHLRQSAPLRRGTEALCRDLARVSGVGCRVSSEPPEERQELWSEF